MWNILPLCSILVNVAAGKGYDNVPASLEYPMGGQSEIDLNRSLPYCRYADIVLLKEKIVSNSLLDLQDMWVKDFIHISLACK